MLLDFVNHDDFFLFQGGFRLQLLDKLERPVLDLTPVTSKSEYVTADAMYEDYVSFTYTFHF